MIKIVFISILATFALNATSIEKSSDKRLVIEQEDEIDKIKLKHDKSLTNPKQDKVNLIYVTQTGCGACKKIKEYIQEDDVKEIIKKNFNLYEVDINFKEELPFKWMKPIATPTLYFLDKKSDEIIETSVSRLTKKAFIDKLNEAIVMRDMD